MTRIYCWNCKETVETTESSLLNVLYAGTSDFSNVVFCSECNAILSPKRKNCSMCGNYRRGFVIGVMIHAGTTNVAICKDCIVSEYISERRKGMGLE